MLRAPSSVSRAQRDSETAEWGRLGEGPGRSLALGRPQAYPKAIPRSLKAGLPPPQLHSPRGTFPERVFTPLQCRIPQQPPTTCSSLSHAGLAAQVLSCPRQLCGHPSGHAQTIPCHALSLAPPSFRKSSHHFPPWPGPCGPHRHHPLSPAPPSSRKPTLSPGQRLSPLPSASVVSAVVM